MNLVRIIIATTANPVTVQRITEEDPDLNSVVCLAGKAMSLPISPAYDAFVRNPTGVVQRHYGHPAFRVDVSTKIDEGYSWQLGLFTAHALHHLQRLAQQSDACDQTLILTGEVDRDLNVLAVNGNAEKTAALRSDIEGLLNRKHKVTIAVPTNNSDHWKTAFSDLLDAFPDLFKILSIQSATQVLDHIGITLPNQSPKNLPVGTPPPTLKKSRWGAGALVLFIGASAVAGGVSYSPEIKALSQQAFAVAHKFIAPLKKEPEPKPKPATSIAQVQELEKSTPKISPPILSSLPKKDVLIATPKRPPVAAPIRIHLSEVRAPDGSTCKQTKAMGTHFVPIIFKTRRSVIRTQDDSKGALCTVKILAKSSADNNFVFGRYQRWTTRRPNTSAPDKTLDLGPRQSNVSWSIDIPKDLQRPAIFQVLILSSANTFEISEKVIKTLDKVRSQGPALDKFRKRMRRSGITLTLRRFRIAPAQNQLRNLPHPNRQMIGQRPPPPPPLNR